MIDAPRTKKQAWRLWEYLTNECFDDARCAWAVTETHPWLDYRQCSRKPGHGPANLYCKQHAKMVTRTDNGGCDG